MEVLNSLIKAVRTPLGFWVYVIGVVALVNMAISGSLKDSGWWLPLLSCLVLATGAIITWLQISRPGVLQSWEKRNAEMFGRDLGDVLVAHYGNLDPGQRAMAWQETIRTIARVRDDEDETVVLFRAVVAEQLRNNIELGDASGVAGPLIAPLGVVEATRR